MIDFERKEYYGFYDLLEIVRILRAPGGCPWDAEQTHESIRRNFIEETYEACEAIDADDPVHLCEELGDVLLQVLFHTSIETDAGRFDIDDVCDGISKKLIYRHPHVFDAVQVADSEEVITNWDALKRAEKRQDTVTDTLWAVSRTLPALWRAEKVQKKAAKAGFSPSDAACALDKLNEEVMELRRVMEEDAPEQAVSKLGDALFSAVNLGRYLAADPEDTLTAATDRFIDRFSRLETALSDQGAPENPPCLRDQATKQIFYSAASDQRHTVSEEENQEERNNDESRIG